MILNKSYKILMKRLKSLLIVLAIISMLFTLTACEKKEENSEDYDSTMTYLTNKKTGNSSGNKEQTNWEKFMFNVKNVSSEEALKNAENQMAEPNKGDTIAIIHVKDYGDIKIKFFEDVAPKAVENFITHAKEGYYDGVIFHRVMNEFMIQGGDPLGTGTGGESIWGKGFEEELDVSVLPYRGALCMASAGTGTSSLGSQFFIVQANYRDVMETYLDYYEISNLKESYKKYGGDLSDLVGYG